MAPPVIGPEGAFVVDLEGRFHIIILSYNFSEAELKRYDFVIVGGGIVGVSTAWQLKQRYADADILLVEKEPGLACHQTGHNSGVIHAGVYYQPGSLKADFCRRGRIKPSPFAGSTACRSSSAANSWWPPTPPNTSGWRPWKGAAGKTVSKPSA